MTTQQRSKKSASVEEKESLRTLSKLNFDRKIQLSSHFHPSVFLTVSINEGQKKILLFKHKFFTHVTQPSHPKADTNRTPESVPKALEPKLQRYLEKSFQVRSFSFQNKPRIDKLVYQRLQLCAGFNLQRNQTIKTQQLSLLYVLLYYFPIRLQNISNSQFGKETFFKYVDENKKFLSPSTLQDFESDFTIIQHIAEWFYSQVPYLDSSKGEHTYSFLNLKRFLNEDMEETCQTMGWEKKYTLSDFYYNTKKEKTN